MKVVAVWCDGKAQLSTDKPIASQDDKAMKKIPGQALCNSCSANASHACQKEPESNLSLSFRVTLLHFECEHVSVMFLRTKFHLFDWFPDASSSPLVSFFLQTVKAAYLDCRY